MSRFTNSVYSICALASCLFSVSAQAYTSTLTGSGVPIRHPGYPLLQLAGDASNRSGLSATAVFNAVTKGLNRWKQASRGVVQFDYWQGSGGSFIRNSDYNGESSIYFASNAAGATGLSSSVLAITQVWHNTATGEILETDIALNDIDFQFTDNPSDSSAYGSRRVYLGNVVTHELGHALGLSHSGSMQATMLYLENPEQSRLSCDDISGIRGLYAADVAGSGALRGRVLSESGTPVFGAQVAAISETRGVVLATAITNSSGNYEIRGIEPGSYILLAEPYTPGSSTLSSYYNSMNARICGSNFFVRSFLETSNRGRLASMTVNAGGTTDAPALTARCATSGSGASVIALSGGDSFSNPIAIAESVVDLFTQTNGQRRYFQVSLSGNAQISALSYGLYSPVRAALRLLDRSGRIVDSRYAQVQTPTFQGASGYVNYDSTLTVRDIPADDYVVEITSSSSAGLFYPAQYLSLDSKPFYVLTVSNKAPSHPDVFATNGRCEASDQFSDYSSPGGGPIIRSTASDNASKTVTGACGTIRSTAGGSSNLPPPSVGTILSWFLPYMIMALTVHLARRRQVDAPSC